MKKIIIETDESKIRLSDVDEDCAIMVKRKGNVIGTITKIKEQYAAVIINEKWDYKRNISVAIKFFPEDCEFYVLE